MKNDTRSNVHHRHTALCLALSAALFAAPVRAEVGLPPPAQHQGAGFPSEKALRQKGYDPKTGVWRVQSQNNGRPTVTKDGGTIKGTQGKTVTVTGKYGEKGVMHTTQTQSVNLQRLQTTANTMIVANLIGQGLNKSSPYIENAARALKDGNYGTAVNNTIMSMGGFLDGILGGGLGNAAQALGRGLGTLPSDSDSQKLSEIFKKARNYQAQAEQGGDLGGAIAAAAAKKAAEGAAAAKQAEQKAQGAREKAKQGKTIWQLTKFTSFMNGSFTEQSLGEYTDKAPRYKRSRAEYDGTGEVNGVVFEVASFSGYLPKKAPKGVFSITIDYKSVSYDQIGRPNPETALKDMMLNQQDIKDILSRMLNNQQTNHAELMNQLSRIGDAVEKSTESNQFTPMTADSAPYTPQGSNTPQQTRFQINVDGSVSATIIQRPDLKPNSTLAPTRSEIVPNPTKGQGSNMTPPTSGSTGTPTTPIKPTTPITPENPTTPVKPITPENPTTPTTPITPDNPTTPTTPITPDDSTTPNTPITPDNPTTPTTPDNPTAPNEPSNSKGQQEKKQKQEQQKEDFCKQNPNAAQCLEAGDARYEDIVLPENTIDLSFSPENVFQTEGVCPQPKSVDLGAFGQVEFSYQSLCDFAAKLRPVLIMMTILTCAWFVYGALEEL